MTKRITNDVITRVRRNDPSVTSINFEYKGDKAPTADQMAHSLGRALQRNNHVTNLYLTLSDLTESGNYDSLLRAIEQSTILEVVILEKRWCANGVNAIGRVADRFLDAISASKKEKELSLRNDRGLGTDPFLSMLHSPAVRDLEVDDCSFRDQSDHAVRNIATGFRENRSLLRLELRNIANQLLVASLYALVQHPMLQHLAVRPDIGEEGFPGTLVAVGDILSASASLESLNLEFFHFSGAMFDPVVRGLRSNQAVTELEIGDCNFDENTTGLFGDLLENNKHIRTLKLIGSNDFTITSGTIVSCILHSNTSLVALFVDLAMCDDSEDAKSIFEALEKNKTLRELVLETMGNEDLAHLNASLPKMYGLKKLTLNLEDCHRWDAGTASILLEGFRRNTSLEQVEIVQDGFKYFDAETITKIQSFCQRNKELPRLLSATLDDMSPSSATSELEDDEADPSETFRNPVLNLRLRPNAYVAAQQMERGNDMIFHDLLRLGDSIGKPKPKRTLSNAKLGKRKRLKRIRDN